MSRAADAAVVVEPDESKTGSGSSARQLLPYRAALHEVADNRRYVYATRALSVVLVLVAWQIFGSKSSFATSYPTAVAEAFAHVAVPTVLPAFGDTLATFGIGFGICVLVGIPLGLGMARIELLRVIFEPYNTVFYSTPFLVFFPVLILAVGVNFGLRVACVIITALFPIVINTFMGAREVDRNLIDVGTAFAASKGQIVRTVVLPCSLPYVFSGLRLGFARGMIGAVVIELEASAVGVGQLLGRYGEALQVADYFVVIFILGVYSVLCSGALRRAERWASMPWARPGWMLSVGRAGVGLRRAVGASASGRRSVANTRWTSDIPMREASAKVSDTSVVSTDNSSLFSATAVARTQGGSDHAEVWVDRPVPPIANQARPDGRERPRTSSWDQWPQSKAGVRVVRIASLLILLGAWQLYSGHVSSAVLPSPISIARATFHLTFVSGSIWAPVGNSCEVLVLSFALSLVLGIPIGLLMGRSRLVEHVADPYVSFLYALPHVAFVPLMVVWLGFGMELRVAYAVFSAIFAVIINTMAGAKNVDREMLAVGHVFCASNRQQLRHILLPATMPYIVAGARQAFSMAWVGVVVAEIVATNTGIGGLITYYSNYFFTADMVVPILYIMAISLVIVKGSTWIQGKLTPWAPHPRL